MSLTRRAALVVAVLAAVVGAWLLGPTGAGASPSLLDQCVTSIDDPAFTKEFILSETGFADEASLLAAVSAGTWTLQISTGPGWTPTLRGSSPDIYCGDSGNNYIQYLDSNPSGSHDFFFGGAGNDSVDTMWDSRFWGGAGDDIIYHNRERSIFYGGPGTNSCLDRESSGSYIAICNNSGGPLLPQAALTIADNTVNVGSTLTLTTAGGSGTGAVSYTLSSAGTAGCSLSGAVRSSSSAGTCTVAATKAADSTYASATTGSVTITVSKLTQAALSISSTSTMLGTNLTLSTSGGSGTGAVSYALSSAGTAGCSLSGAVLSAASVGSCTVTATKAADSTYDLVTTGAVTITVTAVPTTTTTSTSTIPPSTTTTTNPSAVTTTTAAPVLEIEFSASTTVPGAQQPTGSVAVGTQSTVAVKSSTGSTVPSSLVTVVSTSTTTSTVPVNAGGTVPRPAPEVQAVEAGEAAVRIGGTVEKLAVSRIDNQLIVSTGPVRAEFGAVDPSGAVRPLDGDGNIGLRSGDTVRIKLNGFEPGSTVEAWLFSTPVLLGTTEVGADGSVVGTFTVPEDLEVGVHRIAVVARTADGEPATLTVGVTVGDWGKESSVAVWLIVLPIVLAVLGALTLPATRRRRRRTAV